MARKRERNLNELQAQYKDKILNDPGINYTLQKITPTAELLMLVAADKEKTPEIVLTSILECRRAKSKQQCAAFYLSAICGIFPDLMLVCKELFEGRGYKINLVDETNAKQVGLDMQEWIDYSAIYAMIGQIILILFKNIDERSYSNYMMKRAQAINTHAGWDDFLMSDGQDIVFPVEIAKTIKKIVGSQPKVRAVILKLVLAHRLGDDYRSQVFNYVAEMASWTEMAPIMFVFETFCLTKSPALRDGRVGQEVRNLAEALDQIMISDYPQYYRVFHPSKSVFYLTRSRFDTLIEAARKYKETERSTMAQFATGSSLKGNTVADEIVKLHVDHMKAVKSHELDETFTWLTELERKSLMQPVTVQTVVDAPPPPPT